MVHLHVYVRFRPVFYNSDEEPEESCVRACSTKSVEVNQNAIVAISVRARVAGSVTSRGATDDGLLSSGGEQWIKLPWSDVPLPIVATDLSEPSQLFMLLQINFATKLKDLKIQTNADENKVCNIW